MRLLLPISLNIILSIIIYLLERYTSFKNCKYYKKQTIIGLLFGLLAVFASEYGVQISGAVINVRNAAPLSAGLIFGAPAGVISGLIGGAYRWFSVFWGAGTYTRLACTIAVIIAGFLAGILRKLMFDDKKPTFVYGVGISLVCEIMHMLLIFITNINDAANAFIFIQQATLPVIAGNALAVGSAIFAVSLLGREKIISSGRNNVHMSQTFQRWLLVCIIIAYLVTSLFMVKLQNDMTQSKIEQEINVTIQDVYQDIIDASDENLLRVSYDVRDDYLSREDTSTEYLLSLAQRHDVAEINIVSKSGTVIGSTDIMYIGYNLTSGGDSSQFQFVFGGTLESHVQKYQPTVFDPNSSRKYAGIALPSGGMIMVGYDLARFRRDIDTFIIDATKNRHTGTGGFVAVCDENWQLLVDDDLYTGKYLHEIGITIDNEKMVEKTIYKTQVNNIPYMFAYAYAEGYYIIGAIPQSEAMFMRDASIYITIFIEIIIFGLLFTLIYFLIKKVVIRNLRRINAALSEITDGNLDVVVDVRTNKEFAMLSDDINSTVRTLKTYIAEAAARIDKELEYAKSIQLSALPSKFPTTEENGMFDIYARMVAAREVGGDFYDYYMIDGDTVAFLVADVSGKGIPAAMFMMRAKTILKDLAETGLPVNEILSQANDKLCENNESDMFVTAWMGILNLSSGKLTYANAGHNPPLLLHEGGVFEYLKSKPGFVLAGFEGVKYKLNELVLLPGDRLFLYTDGVTEAANLKGEFYGEDKLASFINLNRTKSAKALLYDIKHSIDVFVGDAPQFDDITMLMFDYRREKEDVTFTERAFSAKVESLSDVMDFLKEQFEICDCPKKEAMKLSVAIEEVFVNVANYAYSGGDGFAKLGVSFDSKTRCLTFILSDYGVEFDPLARPDPDITLSANERKIGGLGIYITKRTMDEISYKYENGKNILTMMKKI